jgi:hypothetical protein
MPLIIVGKLSVAAAGSPQRVTDFPAYKAALAAVQLSSQFLTVQAALFQAWVGNTGQVYLGGSALDKTTGANMAAVLAVPTATSIPSFGASNHLSPAGIDLSAIYLDVDTNGEGPLLTVLYT